MPVKALSQVEKGIIWMGSSFEDLLTFPAAARQDAGYQLHRIQNGLDPEDWKPFSDVGPGVNEVRLRDAFGIYRIMYVAKFDEAVYVLHSFQKKKQQTSKSNKQIAIARYQAIIQQRRDHK